MPNVKTNTRPGAKIFACSLAVMAYASDAYSADCSDVDRIYLQSQAEVDSFQTNYGEGGTCDTVLGDLRVNGEDIVDLSALGDLIQIGGTLRIEENPLLETLGGLANITTIGGALEIQGNLVLGNLDVLSGLTTVGVECDHSHILCPSLSIVNNAALSDIDGLGKLQQTEGDVNVGANPLLEDLNGLSALTEIGGALTLSSLASLSDLQDLSSLTQVGQNGLFSLLIENNDALVSLEGLSSLQQIDWLEARENDALQSVDGLKNLVYATWGLEVTDNASLENVDGFGSVEHANSLYFSGNAKLSDCQGVVTLVDPFDDFEPGPGPGLGADTANIPDLRHIYLFGNAFGCSSVNQILGAAPLSGINAGVNDAWFNPETDGQGFFLTVYSDLQKAFLSWYTFDLELPDESATAELGDPGQRWLTAQGEYLDNQAALDVWVAKGGVFDSPVPEVELEPDGQIILDFQTCNEGTVTYDIPSVDRQGVIPIQRVALDNVPYCYSLEKLAQPEPAPATN